MSVAAPVREVAGHRPLPEPESALLVSNLILILRENICSVQPLARSLCFEQEDVFSAGTYLPPLPPSLCPL